jgi:hypothetical protein
VIRGATANPGSQVSILPSVRPPSTNARGWQSISKNEEANMPELKEGCVKPARGPILPAPLLQAAEMTPLPQEAPRMLARVGQQAIDFEATAFVEGVGFQPVKLSDYKGKWIVLCFYPGDFTFV